jgi:DNA processing protein
VAALTGPVRPPPEILSLLVQARALPGVGLVRVGKALRGSGDASPGSGAAAARLRALVEAGERGLDATACERARGWARRALETIDAEDLHVLTPAMASYPEGLRHLPAPPCPLFARGRLDLTARPGIAVVGTRACSRYGREAAHRIAWGLAAAGVTVISGLARGVDGVAHRAAGTARTIAVLGNGTDVFFPTRHRDLQQAIARDGLLASEQLPGTPPVGFHFPRRNGIIAGLSVGCVVIEAPAKSGALSTAARTRELGRDVFAVPGPVDSPASAGTNALIRDGATLVTSAREVLEALGLPPPPADAETEVPPEELHGQGLALWRALGPEPRHVDDIAAAVGLEPRHSLASLLSLEVRGHARQLPGFRFARARTPAAGAGT